MYTTKKEDFLPKIKQKEERKIKTIEVLKVNLRKVQANKPQISKFQFV